MRIPYNIVSLFFEQAQLHPEHVALIENNIPITFRQLDNEVRIIASMYRQNTINKGDRVLIMIPESAALYKHLLAIWYIGAVAVFPNSMKSAELISCKALVAPWKFRAMSFFFSGLRKIPVLLPIVPGKKFDKVCDCIIEDSYKEDPAVISFKTRGGNTLTSREWSHGLLKSKFEALSSRVLDQKNPNTIPRTILVLVQLGLGQTSKIDTSSI